jgi:hypothetical protein
MRINIIAVKEKELVGPYAALLRQTNARPLPVFTVINAE